MAVVGSALALPAAAQTLESRSASGAQAIAVAGGGSGRFEGSYTVRNTPDPASLMGSSVHPCGLPTGISGTGPGFGFAGLITTTGAGCERRATAAAWLALGRNDMAQAVMMQDPISQQAAETLRQQTAAAPAPTVASVTYREVIGGGGGPARGGRPPPTGVPGIQNSECRQ
jgi:hypothetical protein